MCTMELKENNPTFGGYGGRNDKNLDRKNDYVPT